MESYGINLQGPIKIEQVPTLPSWTSADERRVIYVADSDKMYYASGTAWIEFSGGRGHGVTWDESDSSPQCTRTGTLAGQTVGSSPGNALLPIQSEMKRCVLSDAGTIQYYLCSTDSTLKSNCLSAANLDGTDGQVMVEIPKFYYKYSYSGTTHSWSISDVPVTGYEVHPAFLKNGYEVPYRYIGAYEGSMYDNTTGAMVSAGDIVTNMYAAGDKLCSLSGEYPKTNETRAEFRAMASNRGTGWRQLDYYLASAVQLLYLVEYATFYNQSAIGMGRTQFSTGSWVAANQGNGGYIGQCGYSNSDGNATNATDRALSTDISAIDTSQASYQDYMTYRGIENFFGNVYKWVDGFNINDNVPYVSNNDSDFADNTAVNYYALGVELPASNNYQVTLEQISDGFLPATTGGSSSTYITDYYYQNSGWRVAKLGGPAIHASTAGFFYWRLNSDSGDDGVSISGRLCF